MKENDLLFLLILATIVISIRLYVLLKKERLKNVKFHEEEIKLKTEILNIKAERLKFQLQPHTLRNMIATLHVASKNLYRGSEALVDTLDYVLYHGKNNFVSVKDEISFLESYKTLQGNFVFQTNSIKIDKSEVNYNSKFYDSECLPHLITAYLIENAFKHGDKNHPDFLTVRLKLTENSFEINVINRINRLPNNEENGLGLNNMRLRLELLLSGKFEIKSNFNEQEYQSTLTINF